MTAFEKAMKDLMQEDFQDVKEEIESDPWFDEDRELEENTFICTLSLIIDRVTEAKKNEK